MVFHDDSFYVFGGWLDGYHTNNIVKLDAKTLIWNLVGHLSQHRDGHNAIYTGRNFLIVGGKLGSDLQGFTKPTEVCSLDNGAITCVERGPILEYYTYTPEVFLVASDYCKDYPFE